MAPSINYLFRIKDYSFSCRGSVVSVRRVGGVPALLFLRGGKA